MYVQIILLLTVHVYYRVYMSMVGGVTATPLWSGMVH